MERLSYFINKKIHYVTILRTSNKNMYLKVKGQDIVCSAPKRMRVNVIKTFVDQHIKKYIEYIASTKENELYSLQEDFVYLFGKKCPFKRLSGFKTRKISLINEHLYLKSLNSDDADIEFLLKKYLKQSLSDYLVKAQASFEKTMKQNKHLVKTTYKTTSWGANYVKRNMIIYSTRLAHYREEVIDYVIIHELAHSIQADHSKEFWNVVVKYCKDYKKLRNELRADSTLTE